MVGERIVCYPGVCADQKVEEICVVESTAEAGVAFAFFCPCDCSVAGGVDRASVGSAGEVGESVDDGEELPNVVVGVEVFRGLVDVGEGFVVEDGVSHGAFGVALDVGDERAFYDLSVGCIYFADYCLVPISVDVALVGFFPGRVAFVLCSLEAVDRGAACLPRIEDSCFAAAPDDVIFVFIFRHGRCLLR